LIVSIIFEKISKKIVLKSFTVILLSFVLTVSVLTPSMISLMNKSTNTLVENSNEEDKDNNEEKEEIDNEENEECKKEFFLSSLINSNFYDTTSTIVVCFVEITSSCTIEIQLPPPEYSI